jgi:hypothetical protein
LVVGEEEREEEAVLKKVPEVETDENGSVAAYIHLPFSPVRRSANG